MLICTHSGNIETGVQNTEPARYSANANTSHSHI
ncbi:hypothetical protein [Citrobacter phage Tr1]|nr:hypothetical protein [Citrobacter phage Tr1]